MSAHNSQFGLSNFPSSGSGAAGFSYSVEPMALLHKHIGGNVDDMNGNSSSQADSCKLKLSLGNAFQAVMDDNAANLRQNVD